MRFTPSLSNLRSVVPRIQYALFLLSILIYCIAAIIVKALRQIASNCLLRKMPIYADYEVMAYVAFFYGLIN